MNAPTTLDIDFGSSNAKFSAAAGSSVAHSVALVITSYNHGHFLADAIESALAQTRSFGEIIVVDDGSNDDTAEVAARYPSVRCIRQSNQGLAAARNTGLRAAVSTFIVFLDADDRLHSIAVEEGLNCFRANPTAAFVYGRFRYIKPSGVAEPAKPLHDCGKDAYSEFLRGNFVEMHATVMYRRETITALGGFDEKLRACEDYELYLKLARAHPLAGHDAVVADYVLHDANMSSDARLMLITSLDVLKRQRPHIAGDSLKREAYKAGLRNWQECYGSKLGKQIIRRYRSGAPRSVVARDLLLLLTRAPHAVIERRSMIARVILRVTLPYLPFPIRSRLMRRWTQLSYRPRPGKVLLGDLRRLEPLSREFGIERGTPIDRYYIDAFLAAHAPDIRGRVLEIGDSYYTRRHGGERVTVSDVLNVYAAGGDTTIVSDLATGAGIPDNAFDCLIVTQTLHLIRDVPAGIRTLYRVLKPGGVVLLTVPGTISQLEQGQWRSTWYWGFGPLAIEELFGAMFPQTHLDFKVHGNVLASIAFLQGLAAEELTQKELDHYDELYPLLITVRAVKPLKPTQSSQEGSTDRSHG
jgi:glycosyltransferase involved in cell wall biosynthesis/SAM-dependent methyltransferase